MSPPPGPNIRTDLVEAYIFRCADSGAEVLQLLRAHAPQAGVWHPVIGHVEPGETALAACLREVAEEVGLRAQGPTARGVWQLEQVHPYFLAERDAIVLSPRFALEVEPSWAPTLNAEHRDFRWVTPDADGLPFVWPGQRAAWRETLSEIIQTSRYAPIQTWL